MGERAGIPDETPVTEVEVGRHPFGDGEYAKAKEETLKIIKIGRKDGETDY